MLLAHAHVLAHKRMSFSEEKENNMCVGVSFFRGPPKKVGLLLVSFETKQGYRASEQRTRPCSVSGNRVKSTPKQVTTCLPLSVIQADWFTVSTLADRQTPRNTQSHDPSCFLLLPVRSFGSSSSIVAFHKTYS